MKTKRIIIASLGVLIISAVILIIGFGVWKEKDIDANQDKTVKEEIKKSEYYQYKDLIKLETPLPESRVSSPLKIKGEARGNWYFEASFPVILVNWDGLIIAQGTAQAQGDWMTENYVPFEATLEFLADTAVSDRGGLILLKDNPSGMPANDDALELTVFFEKTS